MMQGRLLLLSLLLSCISHGLQINRWQSGPPPPRLGLIFQSKLPMQPLSMLQPPIQITHSFWVYSAFSHHHDFVSAGPSAWNVIPHDLLLPLYPLKSAYSSRFCNLISQPIAIDTMQGPAGLLGTKPFCVPQGFPLIIGRSLHSVSMTLPDFQWADSSS